MQTPTKNTSLNQSTVATDKLKTFFVEHLHRVYCAKSHLAQSLPEFVEQTHFIDLRQAIVETNEDLLKQLARMKEIFILMDEEISFDGFKDLIGLIEIAYNGVHENSGDAELRDLSILFYMQNVESMEMTSFQILQIASIKLNDKRIGQLLKENYDEAKGDRALMKLIMDKYLVN